MTHTGSHRHRLHVCSNLNSGNCLAFWCVRISTGVKPDKPTLLPCPAWNPVFYHILTPLLAFLFLQANLPLHAAPTVEAFPELLILNSSLSVSIPGHQHPVFVGSLPTRKERPELLSSPSWLVLQTSTAIWKTRPGFAGQKSLSSSRLGSSQLWDFVRGTRKDEYEYIPLPRPRSRAGQNSSEQREPSLWVAKQGEDGGTSSGLLQHSRAATVYNHL